MAGGLEVIAGRTYGPFRTTVAAAKVAEFVAATGDDDKRWAEHAPPGYAATLLFSAAPTFFADTDVAPKIAFYVISARNACGSSGEEPF